MLSRMPLVLAAAIATAGCTATQYGPVEDALAVPVCPTETRNWTAWINAMPGPDAVPTLIVQGEVLLPERATARLTAGATDRMQPPGQRFSLTVEPAEEAAGWQVVRGEIKPALPAYAHVIVGCDGAEIARIDAVITAY